MGTIHIDRTDDRFVADDVEYAEEARWSAASLPELSELVQSTSEDDPGGRDLDVSAWLGDEVDALVRACRQSAGDARHRLIADLAVRLDREGLSEADVRTLAGGF